MARKDYASAVEKLEESQRLEPTPGTLLNLALAEEQLGRLAAAWEHTRAAMDTLEASDERAALATASFERLDKRVPRLTLAIREKAPPSLRIERDGLMLRASSIGVALPMNPGKHEIVVTADGHAAARYSIILEEQRSQVLELHIGPVVSDSRPQNGSALRTAGYVSLAAGALGLGVGALTGLFAIGKKDDVSAGCDASGCNPDGIAAAKDGRTFATASTVSFVVGGVLAAGGLTAVLWARSRAATSVAIASDSLWISRRF
jgi:hypothetical protein